MNPLNEYIKLRTELIRELTHLELDQHALFVSNPWSEKRLYKEGMIVYYGDTSTGGSGNLTWFRANQDHGPSLLFDPSKWDPIGANGISGQIFVKDSNNIINTTGVLEFTDDFILTYNGNTAKVELNPGSVGFWAPSPSDSSTIHYDDSVLIGTDTPISSSYKLSVAGNQIITGNLNVSGLINGINLVNFFNDYSLHTHTIVPQTLVNYNALYPNSNGALADVNVNTGTLVTDDVLAWDNTIKRWINKTLTTGPHNLGSHTDVNPSVSVAPLSNQILRYNSGTSKWENVTVALDTSNGFSTAPFSHNHDGRYWTKSQLSAITGPIINYSNIFGAPAVGAPSNASYVVIGLDATLTNERVLTGSSSILITDSGVNSPVTLTAIPKSTHQLVQISKDNVNVGIRSRINFVTPGSGTTYTITDDSFNDVVNVQVNTVPPIIPPAPVLSVNTQLGNVSLGIADMDDVVINPFLFPGVGVGSPYNPLSNLLVYDDDISKWVNVPASALIAAVSNIYLDDILDVEIGTTSLVDKNLLYYDQFSGLWVNGSAADADLYTATELNAGQLNNLYYTETELSTPASGALVHWLNLTGVPSFAPASHSHYLWQITDVKNYQFTPPNNGDILIWNSTYQYWEALPNPGGGGGFSTVINNYTTLGTYTSATDQTINPSNLVPLKFQTDSGIILETDLTDNIVKIGVDVDGTTIGFNTAGQLTFLGASGDGCYTYIVTSLVADTPFIFGHPIGSSDIVVTLYDSSNNVIEIDTNITTTDVTLQSAVNLNNVKVVLVSCAGIGGSGGTVDTFADLGTSLPTDGTFTDGVFQWQTTTKLVDAFDDLNELLLYLIPPSAPILSDWTGSKAGTLANGKLSFDSVNPIAAASYVGADTAPSSPISVDGQWTASGKRLAIAPALTGDVTGVLNDQVAIHGGSPTPAYSANSFGDAEKGELKLYVNGILTNTLDLTSSTSSIDSTSSGTVSGFIVSAQVPSYFSTGGGFAAFQNRTGTWRVVDNDSNLVQGYNYVYAVHTNGTFTRTLARFEWIIDDNTTATSITGASLHGLSMSGTKKLSGIDYHTSGTALYDVTVDNLYRNTYYSGADAITHTGNSNSYGVLLTAPQQALLSCAGDEAKSVDIINKVATITPTGIRIINNSISLNTTGKRTVQGNSSGGSSSINNLLLDNVTASATAASIENFDDENYRLNTNSSYNLISDITSSGNLWDSTQSLFDGSAGHTTGLQVTDGKLIYPSTAGGSLDYRTSNIINGSTFNDGGTGGGARNYTALTGSRTYIRHFRQVSPTTANFVMKIDGSGGTFVSDATALTGNNIHVHIKGPTETGWMDAYKDFSTGLFLDGDGARSATGGVGRAFGTNWGLTIGTKNTANTGGYMVIRITVGASFTGNIDKITWTFS